MTRVVLFGKPNCSLCEQALDVINSVRKRYAFELIVRNILESFDEYEQYKHDIPVIMLNGVELARHRITEPQLISAITEHAADPTPHQPGRL